MRHTRSRALVAVFFFASLVCGAAALAPDSLAQGERRESAPSAPKPAAGAPEISFTVSMPQPHTHMLEVEARLRWGAQAAPPRSLDLVMPVWTPGSYLVREFERHVRDFEARGGGDGRALSWSKTNKNTWRVETGGAREVRARYSVYANEMTVRTNELNDRHAFWNNAALLVYPEGHTGAPSTLRVVATQNWKVATSLPPVSGETNLFRAENFDALYDAPVEVGTFKTISFDVRGVTHRFVIDGEGNYDAERVSRDVKKIVEGYAAMMGGLPMRDYTFILHLRANAAGGGLEHANSTALLWPRFDFRPEAKYTEFLELVSHEYFHLWNVKRIRPAPLSSFDYSRENYSRLLWVAEGLTAYYEKLMLRRVGLITEKDYLEKLGTAVQTMQRTPGRLEMSAEEASFDAWIKYYRRDENSINAQVSYYDKGALLGLLLDLHIRRMSQGQRSLDDVMRRLHDEFAKRDRDYTPEDFQRAAESAAGGSLEDFFRRYIRGREELDYDAALSAAGLRLDTSGGPDAKPKAFLGATFTAENEQSVLTTTALSSGAIRSHLPAGALVVKQVPTGSPAEGAGLNAGDYIIALDGVRVTRETFNTRLEEKRPGDTVRLALFRHDELRTFDVKLGGRVDAPFRVVPVAAPSDAQKKIYESWLGAPFPVPTPTPTPTPAAKPGTPQTP